MKIFVYSYTIDMPPRIPMIIGSGGSQRPVYSKINNNNNTINGMPYSRLVPVNGFGFAMIGRLAGTRSGCSACGK